MSLDIWGVIPTKECECPNCEHEFTKTKEVFDMNITHNLRKMAREAGCGILWDMERNTKAWELINPIKEAIKNLSEEPDKFDNFCISEDWGTREQFIPWLGKLLGMCQDFPQAIVNISK